MARREGGIGSSAAPLRVVRAVGIDVEIDELDTALALHMPVTGMPRALAKLNVADLGELEAFPLAAGRQALAAAASELIGQCDLLPTGVAKDDRAEFARVAVVHTKDLLAITHGFFEQLVSRAGHSSSHHYQ